MRDLHAPAPACTRIHTCARSSLPACAPARIWLSTSALSNNVDHYMARFTQFPRIRITRCVTHFCEIHVTSVRFFPLNNVGRNDYAIRRWISLAGHGCVNVFDEYNTIRAPSNNRGWFLRLQYCRDINAAWKLRAIKTNWKIMRRGSRR